MSKNSNRQSYCNYLLHLYLDEGGEKGNGPPFVYMPGYPPMAGPSFAPGMPNMQPIPSGSPPITGTPFMSPVNIAFLKISTFLGFPLRVVCLLLLRVDILV